MDEILYTQPKRSKLRRLVEPVETLMEVQEYRPPRKRHVNPLSLDGDQRSREEAYTAGVEAYRGGGVPLLQPLARHGAIPAYCGGRPGARRVRAGVGYRRPRGR